jgi:hypothetical protein
MSNTFAAMENLDKTIGTEIVGDSIGENIRLSAKETLGCNDVKREKLWSGELCPTALDKGNAVEL